MKRKSAVLTFIENERAKGKTDKDIQHMLLDAGWHMDIIKHAMEERDHSDIKILSTPEQKIYEKLLNPYAVAGIFILLAILALII